jgi:hypothetical protein
VPQGGREEPVQAVQRGSRPRSFERGDLLSPSENFERAIHAAEENADGRQERSDQREHESTVLTSHHASTGAETAPWGPQATDLKGRFDYGHACQGAENR